MTAGAPSSLSSRVSSGRPRLPFERAVAEVKRRTGVDLSRARARAGFARGHLVDVAVFVPGGKGKPEETEAASQVVDFLLGEEQRRDFIGEIRTAPAPRGGALKVLDQRSANLTDRQTDKAAEMRRWNLHMVQNEAPGTCHSRTGSTWECHDDLLNW